MFSCFKFFQSEDKQAVTEKAIRAERNEIILNAAGLVVDVADPYQASLPMMIYAELGLQNQCRSSIERVIKFLDALKESAEPSWQWMQNNSFQAWMWGRVLLAAQTLENDSGFAAAALSKIKELVEQPLTKEDKQEFIAWAWAYQAAYSLDEYQLAKKSMLAATKKLAQQFQDSGINSTSPNEYWGWVMVIQAAARANDSELYEKIKKYLQIGPAGKPTSIGDVLARQLGKGSTNYLAWALAKVRLAAAMMKDEALFLALEEPVEIAISQAEKNQSKAEFSLAILDNARANQWMDKWVNYEDNVLLESKEALGLRIVRN